MATVEEIELEIKNAIEKRYGEGAVKDIFHEQLRDANGNLTGVHHWVVKYIDDKSILHVDHDFYAEEDSNGNLYWRNVNPLAKFELMQQTQTFADKIRQRINDMVKNGEALYAEIISINEELERARAFIKTDSEEGTYIVWIDENGNMQKIKTSFA
ncbi:MAG: hypothetical protein H5T50_05440 [Nitrososphaeria archaeon]|nr:hypothetical protein [Nitrososphaeria archaeon]